MKYGYEGASKDELIQNYKTFDDKIIITFLDGSNYEIPFTDENEKQLLKKMIKQAKKRNKSGVLSDIEEKIDEGPSLAIIVSNMVSSCMFSFSTLQNLTDPQAIWKNISLISVTVFLLSIGKYGLNMKRSIDEINELLKYDIYLSIRKKLEKTKDHNLFNGIKSKETTLNINTLDHYSLKDLEKIQENLKRSKKYSEYLKKSIDQQPIVKSKKYNMQLKI